MFKEDTARGIPVLSNRLYQLIKAFFPIVMGSFVILLGHLTVISGPIQVTNF